MKFSILLTFVALVRSGLSMNGFPAICTWDPPISVEAGASLSARIDNPWSGRCTATLRFSDSEFLPINWSFDAIQCADFELAKLSMPVDLPNGDAYIIWQCAGQAALTCSHVQITNGRGNIGAVSLDQSGTVGCVSSTRQTLTTLITRTNPAGVQVETSVSTLTAATTSFQTATTAPAVAGAQTLTAAVLLTVTTQTATTPAPVGTTTQPLDAPPTPPGTTTGTPSTNVDGPAATTPAELTPVAPPAGTTQVNAASASPLLTSTATLTITDCMVPCSTTIAPA